MPEATVRKYQSQKKGMSQDFSAIQDFLEIFTAIDDGYLNEKKRACNRAVKIGEPHCHYFS